MPRKVNQQPAERFQMFAPQGYYTAAQVAQACGVTVRCVQGWRKDGLIPSVKIGGARRYYGADLNDAIGE